MFGRMKRRPAITQLLVSRLAAGLLLAACSPAPTALPPTAIPPTSVPTAVPAAAVPATAVPPTPAPTLAPPTATAVPATAKPTPNLLAQVTAFQAAFKQQDTDALMALFTADPTWALRFGMFAYVGTESGTGYIAVTTQTVRDILDIDFQLKTHLEASNCSMKNDVATCDLVIKDNCNPPATSDYHLRAQFAFQDGKIHSVSGYWQDSEKTAFQTYDAPRQSWASQNLPVEEAAYHSFSPDAGQPGLPLGETASQFGQAVERICTRYAAAAH